MGEITTGFSMSLDGFIAGPHDEVDQVFRWYSSGDTEYLMPNGTMNVKISSESAEALQEVHETTGALVMGRRTFDIANAWGGRHPLDVPVFVVTHLVPEEWDSEESPFTFVTEGIESAVEQAQSAAGDKNVSVGAASIAQQCINAGLLDEIHIDLIPVLLSDGIRLFEHLDTGPIELKKTKVIDAPEVTHIKYQIVS